jgi:hypothetical protein
MKTTTPKYGYFRPVNRCDNTSGVLHVWIEHGGEVRFIPTTYDVRPEEWDSIDSELILSDYSTGRGKRLAVYARCMDRNMRLLKRIVEDYSKSKAGYTVDRVADTFKELMLGMGMLGVYAAVQAEDLAASGNASAAKSYQTTARRFLDFNGGYDLDMNTITPDTMREFQRRLIFERVNRSTISFYMRILRAIYNKAVAERIVIPSTQSPFDEVYTKIELAPKKIIKTL